jgi:chromosome segregation ATPase
LVDKYWNGTKSLHKNYKFLGLANQALSLNAQKSYETNQLNILQSQINNLKDENSRLNQMLKDQRANKDQGTVEIEKKNKHLMDENVSNFCWYLIKNKIS